MKIIFLVFLFLICSKNEIFANGNQISQAEKVSDNEIVFAKLNNHDIDYFRKEWELADEKEKQAIVKLQRELFNQLLTEISLSTSPETSFLMIAKLTRITPIYAPYQIKVLRFISSQKEKKQRQLFSIMQPYFVNLSKDDIKFSIQNEEKNYWAYNTDILECFFLERILDLQIIFSQKDSQANFINKLILFFQKINSLEMKIVFIEAKIDKDKDVMNFEIRLSQPNAKIIFFDKKFECKIDRLSIK